MIRASRFPILCLRGGALVGTFLVFVAVASSQPAGGKDKRLDAEPIKGADQQTFTKLRDGQAGCDASHKALLDKAARWYVNRLTWLEFQQKSLEGGSANPITVNDLVQDAFRQLPDLKKAANPNIKDNQKTFLQHYGKALTGAIDDVLKNPMPIARVNAARILARLGEGGQEEVGDAMVKVLEDKEQLDAVKLYALRGLRELFLASGARFKSETREARCIKAIVDFLNRKPSLPKDASPEQVDAFRYLRREAVRALGQVRVPLVVENKKVTARPAYELLRVVSKDGFNPPPSVSEQVEAALGVCQLQSRFGPGYQPDYAAHHLGHFLADFVTLFGTDRGTPGIRSEPWKVYAVQLLQGLDTFRTENKTDKYVIDFASKIEPLLKTVSADKQPLAATITSYRAWLGQNRPKAAEVFKGDASSAVKLPEGDS